MAGPLLERQLAPIPEPPPISEERLQEKGKRVCPHLRVLIVSCTRVYSKEMATITVKAVQREEKVWVCGGSKRRHATRTREEDNP